MLPCFRCRRSLLPFALIALLGSALAARAVPLAPGETVTPNSRTGGGGTEIVSDDPLFTFGTVTGELEWRVTSDSIFPPGIDPSLSLRFSYQIYNDSTPGSDSITSMELSDFSGVAVDVVYNPGCFGESDPTSATRSADGSTVTLVFAGGEAIGPGEQTRCIYVRTDGADIEEGGSIVLRSALGGSIVLPSFQPVPEPEAAPLGALAGLALVAGLRRARRHAEP